MSTIVGIWNFQRQSSEALALQGQQLMNNLRMYPSDASAVWQDEDIFLGCHDRWITEESVNQTVPYHDPISGLVITADAIIDNREELFEALGISRAEGSTLSDVLLILRAYQKWEEHTPQHLVGDFAFMIWDTKKHQLYGARDWSGNRTLYYYHTSSQFAFSTLMEPLFQTGDIQKKMSTPWMAEFLTMAGMTESLDIKGTVYEDILQLPPAHAIILTEQHSHIFQYGTLLPEEPLHLRSNGEYEEAFRDVFTQAVKSKVRTRLGVASTLSGGLDSGAVVSYASKILAEQGKSLQTYSYVPIAGFDDWTSSTLVPDERPYIEETLKYIGNVQGNYLDFADRNPLTEVDSWLDFLEMPYKYFENSFWIRGIFEQAQQQGAGVLLTGARGNFTISWGPALDYYAVLLKKFQWTKLYRELKLYGHKTGVGRSRLLPIIHSKAFPKWNQTAASKDRPNPLVWINSELARQTGMVERVQQQEEWLVGREVQNAFDIRLEKFKNLAIANKNGAMTSKISEHYGVWERDPTSDARVVRFCLSIPVGQYVQEGMDRALIRRATAGDLPDKVRLNQKVRGMQPADWVQRMQPQWSSFTGELRDLCKDPKVAAWMNTTTIMKALEKVGEHPQANAAAHPATRMLMRSLIVGRFIRNLA